LSVLLEGAAAIGIQHTPYGNPASFGEPRGLWTGEADVAGDATGGFIRVAFVPQSPITTTVIADQRRQYVYFVDGATIEGGPAFIATYTVAVIAHWARANFALDRRFFWTKTVETLEVAGQRVAREFLIEAQMQRTPIFWDTQELAIGTAELVVLTVDGNVNNNEHRFRAYGRYYDRQLLSNRSFGRLVAPPPVAPGE